MNLEDKVIKYVEALEEIEEAKDFPSESCKNQKGDEWHSSSCIDRFRNTHGGRWPRPSLAMCHACNDLIRSFYKIGAAKRRRAARLAAITRHGKKLLKERRRGK